MLSWERWNRRLSTRMVVGQLLMKAWMDICTQSPRWFRVLHLSSSKLADGKPPSPPKPLKQKPAREEKIDYHPIDKSAMNEFAEKPSLEEIEAERIKYPDQPTHKTWIGAVYAKDLSTKPKHQPWPHRPWEPFRDQPERSHDIRFRFQQGSASPCGKSWLKSLSWSMSTASKTQKGSWIISDQIGPVSTWVYTLVMFWVGCWFLWCYFTFVDSGLLPTVLNQRRNLGTSWNWERSPIPQLMMDLGLRRWDVFTISNLLLGCF